MEIIDVKSYDEFKANLDAFKRAFLLIYKSGTERSDCAYNQIKMAAEGVSDIRILAADVNSIKDIHTKYEITTAPTLLQFIDGKFVNTIKGCNSMDHYKGIFEDAVYQSSMKEDGVKQKSVTVYSTPTCSWCTTLKTYLKKNRIQFTDIDISRDQNAAQELVRRSGQQGVPQTEIDGQIVAGFDKTKLNQLLEIKG